MFSKEVSPLVKRTVTPEAVQERQLTAAQLQGVICLFACSSVREAAEMAGVSERTMHRWLKLDYFHEAVREAGRRCVEQAGNLLQGSAGEAVKALKKVLEEEDASASSRVMAARTVLTVAYKVIELHDVQDRIKALEHLVLTPDMKWKP